MPRSRPAAPPITKPTVRQIKEPFAVEVDNLAKPRCEVSMPNSDSCDSLAALSRYDPVCLVDAVDAAQSRQQRVQVAGIG